MDIHDIALTLFTQLVGAHHNPHLDDSARLALGREAYRYAEAFIAAKDVYIREQPVSEMEQGY